MVKPLQRLIPYLREHFQRPLYLTGYLLALTALIPAIAGYLFWSILARLMPIEEIGTASALISVTSFLTLLSGIDLGTMLIRYIPESANPVKLLNTTIIIRVVTSAMSAIIFLLGINFWSPAQNFLVKTPLIAAMFSTGIIIQSINELLVHVFVARRKASLGLAKNIYVTLIRFPMVIIPIILIKGFDGVGIFLCITVGVLMVLIYSFIRQIPNAYPDYRFRFEVDMSQIQQFFKFSILSFIGEIALDIPLMVMPIIIINQLGEKASGIAYIVLMISNVASMLPQGLARSLLAEGTYNRRNLRSNLIRTLSLSLIVEIAFIIGIILLGRIIVAIAFGPIYADNGLPLLIWSSLAVIPTTIVIISFSLLRVQNQRRRLVEIGLISCITSLTAIVILIPLQGLSGVGLGFLIGQTITAVAALFVIENAIEIGTSETSPRILSFQDRMILSILDEQTAHLGASVVVLNLQSPKYHYESALSSILGNDVQIISRKVDTTVKISPIDVHNLSADIAMEGTPTVDFIFDSAIIEQSQDIQQYRDSLNSFASVINQGSQCLILCSPLKATDESFISAAKEAGFTVVQHFYCNHFSARIADKVRSTLHSLIPIRILRNQLRTIALMVIYCESRLLRRIRGPVAIFLLQKAE